MNEGKAEAVAHKPAEGVTLDPEKAEEAVLDAYPASGERVRAAGADREAECRHRGARPGDGDYAQPAVSAPIELTVGDKSVELSPEELAPALKLTINPDHSHTPTLDAKKLEPLFQKRFKDLETLPKDASIELRGGTPTVVPAKDGMVVDRAKVVPAILATLPKPSGQRKATVGLAKQPAKFTTAAAQKLGVKEKISEFTTEFPHADYRNTNIGRAAELINGTLLKPNEVFSLNKIVGERTAANGFTDGYVINRGVLVKDLGGGVSQSATTTFNAAFFAGLDDVEHKAHSFYISRYPVGREATVAWPSVDLKFRNDSGHGVLIETGFRRSSGGSNGAITVRMWGTKVWDIKSGQSDRFNGRAPKVIYNEKPGCEKQAPVAGFDIKIYRYFNRNGERVKTESFTTHYNAADDIRCGKKPTGPAADKATGPLGAQVADRPRRPGRTGRRRWWRPLGGPASGRSAGSCPAAPRWAGPVRPRHRSRCPARPGRGGPRRRRRGRGPDWSAPAPAATARRRRSPAPAGPCRGRRSPRTAPRSRRSHRGRRRRPDAAGTPTAVRPRSHPDSPYPQPSIR